MVAYNTLGASLTLLHLLTQTLAQDLPEPIVGCDDLSCPQPGEGKDYTCTVADANFASVGLARIPDVPSSLDGISLLKGVEEPVSAGTGNGDRDYTSSYYLGTPSGLDLADLNGCAVIFHDTEGGRKFGDGTDNQNDRGVCSDVIAQSCLDALRELAENTGNCTALRADLESVDVEECVDMTGTGKGLGNFTVTSWGDVEAIGAAENGTSDCWPVMPKSDGLAPIMSDTVRGDAYINTTMDQLFKITPLLTVFYPGEGDGGLVEDTAAQMTCLKVVGAVEPPEEGESVASGYRHSLFAVASTGLVAAMAVLL